MVNLHFKYRGVAQSGRALGLGPRCRRFESCHLDWKSRDTLLTDTLKEQHPLEFSGKPRK